MVTARKVKDILFPTEKATDKTPFFGRHLKKEYRGHPAILAADNMLCKKEFYCQLDDELTDAELCCLCGIFCEYFEETYGCGGVEFSYEDILRLIFKWEDSIVTSLFLSLAIRDLYNEKLLIPKYFSIIRQHHDPIAMVTVIIKLKADDLLEDKYIAAVNASQCPCELTDAFELLQKNGLLMEPYFSVVQSHKDPEKFVRAMIKLQELNALTTSRCKKLASFAELYDFIWFCEILQQNADLLSLSATTHILDHPSLQGVASVFCLLNVCGFLTPDNIELLLDLENADLFNDDMAVSFWDKINSGIFDQLVWTDIIDAYRHHAPLYQIKYQFAEYLLAEPSNPGGMDSSDFFVPSNIDDVDDLDISASNNPYTKLFPFIGS